MASQQQLAQQASELDRQSKLLGERIQELEARIDAFESKPSPEQDSAAREALSQDRQKLFHDVMDNEKARDALVGGQQTALLLAPGSDGSRAAGG
jgi:predicted  nucleic acid-binding Zn-ribbon protein